MTQEKKNDSESKVDLPVAEPALPAVEIGGRKGPDPTRYGDWEIGGKCVDF